MLNKMYKNKGISLSMFSGSLAVIFFLISHLVSKPAWLLMLVNYSIGPFLIVGIIGIYKYLYTKKNLLSLKIGLLLSCISGLFISISLLLQDIIHIPGLFEAGINYYFFLKPIHKFFINLSFVSHVIWISSGCAGFILIGLHIIKRNTLAWYIGMTGIILSVEILILSYTHLPFFFQTTTWIYFKWAFAIWLFFLFISIGKNRLKQLKSY